MPIRKVKGGYKWGNHGHVYPTREGAEKQAEAAHANGYRGDDQAMSDFIDAPIKGTGWDRGPGSSFNP